MEKTAPLYKTASEICQGAEYEKLFPCHLRYNGPGDSGFGIKRITMLMPDTAMLMVSPYGCGRSGTVVGQKEDFEKRVFYYAMSETDVVTGTYQSRLSECIEIIKKNMNPRAVLICLTCIDSLMGTDLKGLCKALTRQCGLPVTGTFMDPITRDTNNQPLMKVQRAIYDCLENKPKDGSLGLIGNYSILDKSSDLYKCASLCGFGTVRQLPACNNYDEFLDLAGTSVNLCMTYLAQRACEDIFKRFETPFIRLYNYYSPDRTEQQYEQLFEFFGARADLSEMKEKAYDMLSDFAEEYSNLSFAVSDSVAGSSVEMAETLIDAGLDVKFVFRNVILPEDRASLKRLCEKAPDLKIFSGVHPSVRANPEKLPHADVIAGLDAGYFEPSSVSVNFSSEQTHFGYEALTSLITALEQGIASPKTLKEQMSGSYLTV
jgi:nitrogenase molybdenum-cofactor synthesis protein NifE